jgi:hypothetical protein
MPSKLMFVIQAYVLGGDKIDSWFSDDLCLVQIVFLLRLPITDLQRRSDNICLAYLLGVPLFLSS